MRWGVLSDVHGNKPALDAALRTLADTGVDRLVCAGDLVGYGPHPNECVAEIAERGIPCVTGNHDLMAIERLGYERADELARTTLDWTRGALGAEARDFLAGLPVRLDLPDLTVAHGSLDDPTVYVDDDPKAARELARSDTPVLVLGHTHVALAYGERDGRLLRGRSGRVTLAPGERYLLNPGSVGQARERRPVGRVLVLDAAAGRADFQAVRYDHRRTRAALVANGLPPHAYHRKPSLRYRAGRLKARLRSLG